MNMRQRLLLIFLLLSGAAAMAKSGEDVHPICASKCQNKKLKPTADLARLDNGYYLAFRATAGVGQPVYEALVSVGYNDDDPLVRLAMPCGCLSADGRNFCDRHYRGSLLDSRTNAIIDRVRFSLYKSGVEEAWAEFDVMNAHTADWFSAERLINSSWSDLSQGPWNFFSIPGYVTGDANRRFYISRRHGGCLFDQGWAVILDTEDGCQWGSSSPAYPAFLYSKKSTYTHWTCLTEVETGPTYWYKDIWTENNSKIPASLEERKSLVFSVKACKDAHVLLTEKPKDGPAFGGSRLYEIVIGGWVNQRSVIRTYKQQNPAQVRKFHQPMHCEKFQRFYVDWAGGEVKVGKVDSDGKRKRPFIAFQDPDPFHIAFAYVSGWNVNATWRFEPATPCDAPSVGRADVMTVSVKFLDAANLEQSCLPSD